MGHRLSGGLQRITVTLHYTSTIMISFKQNIEPFDKNLSEVKV